MMTAEVLDQILLISKSTNGEIFCMPISAVKPYVMLVLIKLTGTS